MPNNPLIVAALQAICAGGAAAELIDGGWRRDRFGAPRYEFWNGAGGRIVVRFAHTEAADAWRDVRALSSLTLDVATSVLSALSSDPFRQAACGPRCEPVSLGAVVVLNAKGYRRYGAERAQFAQTVGEELDRLERLRFDIISYPGYDPRSRRWNASGISRGDIALVERAGCEHLVPANDTDDCAFARPLRVGAWADHWFTSGGVMWTAPIPEEILQLDHRENRSPEALAKRIALMVHLSFGATRTAKTIRLSLRQLLRRIGVLTRMNVSRPGHSGRIADRLEEALLRLSEQGVLCSSLETSDALALRAAGRAWFDHWLESDIIFERPLADSLGR